MFEADFGDGSLCIAQLVEVLFEAGLITEAERNRMKNKISALAPSASNEVGRSIQA